MEKLNQCLNLCPQILLFDIIYEKFQFWPLCVLNALIPIENFIFKPLTAKQQIEKFMLSQQLSIQLCMQPQ